ncbi:MAG: alanine/ornithine racemase family PLP-dependent enzyme [Peptostreptococcaceae bacterium]|nr:alanine/ornithine racemase family PLP-dependent enzyme [Peptostreptococcaceae bacterium]
MERYPLITIDKNKLANNARAAIELTARKGIVPVAITKLFQGDPQIAQILVDQGIKSLGDSRIQNLIKLKDIDAEKILIRLPMLSEIDLLVEYADISLNSEFETIRAISEYCVAHGKSHKIVLMLDMGDRREGILEEDLDDMIESIMALKGIQLVGLGVNFGCYGGIIPSPEAMQRFGEYKKHLEQKYDLTLTHMSGGNSLTLHMIWENILPEGSTHLRLGQSINIGVEDRYGEVIEGFEGNAYMLHAEVIEKKRKSSVPVGQVGVDAFGNVPVFEDRGDIDRVIVGIGKQDMYFDALTPVDEGVKILGGSSDHMILDITDAKREFNIGDILSFEMGYSSVLMGLNSDYVYKKIID